jgi:hypothetical protein
VIVFPRKKDESIVLGEDFILTDADLSRSDLRASSFTETALVPTGQAGLAWRLMSASCVSSLNMRALSA